MKILSKSAFDTARLEWTAPCASLQVTHASPREQRVNRGCLYICSGFPAAEARPVFAVLCTSALRDALIQARVERSGRLIEITASGPAKLLDAAKNWSRLSAAADTDADLNQMFGERPC